MKSMRKMMGSFQTAGTGSFHRSLGHVELGSDSESGDEYASVSESSNSQISFAGLFETSDVHQMRDINKNSDVGSKNIASNSADDSLSPKSPKSPTSVLDIMVASSVVAVASEPSIGYKSEGSVKSNLPNASSGGNAASGRNEKLRRSNSIGNPLIQNEGKEESPTTRREGRGGKKLIALSDSSSSLSAPRNKGLGKSKSLRGLQCTALDMEVGRPTMIKLASDMSARKDDTSPSNSQSRPLAQTTDRSMRKTESFGNDQSFSTLRRQEEEALPASSHSSSTRRRKNSGLKKSTSSRGLKCDVGAEGQSLLEQESRKQSRDTRMRKSKSMRALTTNDALLNDASTRKSHPPLSADSAPNSSECNRKLRRLVVASSETRRDDGMRKAKSVRGLRSVEESGFTVEPQSDLQGAVRGLLRSHSMTNLVPLETEKTSECNPSNYAITPRDAHVSSRGPKVMRKSRSLRALNASGDLSADATSSEQKDARSKHRRMPRPQAIDRQKSSSTNSHSRKSRKKSVKSRSFDFTKESASVRLTTNTDECRVTTSNIAFGYNERVIPSGRNDARRSRSRSMNMVSQNEESPLASTDTPLDMKITRRSSMTRISEKKVGNDLFPSTQGAPEINDVTRRGLSGYTPSRLGEKVASEGVGEARNAPKTKLRSRSKLRSDSDDSKKGKECTKRGDVDGSRKEGSELSPGECSTAAVDVAAHKEPLPDEGRSFRSTQMSPEKSTNGRQKSNKHSLKGLKDVRNKLGQSLHCSQMRSTKGSNQSITSQSHSNGGSISSLTMSSRLFTQDDFSISSSQKSRLRRAFSSPRLYADAGLSLDEDDETSNHDMEVCPKTSRWESLPQRRASADSVPVAPNHDVSIVGLLPSVSSSAGTEDRWSTATKTGSNGIRMKLEGDCIPVRPSKDTSSYCGSVAQPSFESDFKVPGTPSYSIYSNSGMISDLSPGTCMGDISRTSRSPLETKFQRDGENSKFNSWMSSLSNLLVHADIVGSNNAFQSGIKKKDGAPKMVRRHSCDSLSHLSFSHNDQDSVQQEHVAPALLADENDNAPRRPSRRISLGNSLCSRQS